jgi:hypothetical protein
MELLPHEVLERNLQGALAIWVLQKPKWAPSWLQTSYNENLWQSLNPLSLKRSHVKDCKTPNACPAEKSQFVPVFVSYNHRLCFCLTSAIYTSICRHFIAENLYSRITKILMLPIVSVSQSVPPAKTQNGNMTRIECNRDSYRALYSQKPLILKKKRKKTK